MLKKIKEKLSTLFVDKSTYPTRIKYSIIDKSGISLLSTGWVIDLTNDLEILGHTITAIKKELSEYTESYSEISISIELVINGRHIPVYVSNDMEDEVVWYYVTAPDIALVESDTYPVDELDNAYGLSVSIKHPSGENIDDIEHNIVVGASRIIEEDLNIDTVKINQQWFIRKYMETREDTDSKYWIPANCYITTSQNLSLIDLLRLRYVLFKLYYADQAVRNTDTVYSGLDKLEEFLKIIEDLGGDCKKGLHIDVIGFG